MTEASATTASTLLVVGNGLSVDLRSHHMDVLEHWHPSSPLSWSMPSVDDNGDSLLRGDFPRFAACVDRLADENESDFDVFAKCLEELTPIAQKQHHGWNQEHFDACVTISEVRHFLAIAYSYFQHQVDTLDLAAWRWTKFIDSHRHEFAMAISMNYDLVIESVFDVLCIKGKVFKPHGSIDFRPHPNAIVMQSGYPLKNCLEQNDIDQHQLARGQLLQPRIEADVVLPTEYSPFGGFQWVRPGYQFLEEHGQAYERCLMIGMSYWECDRDEIDFMLGSLRPGSELILANPAPSADLIERAAALQLEVKIWPDGPESFL